jgi:hypothetical protein
MLSLKYQSFLQSHIESTEHSKFSTSLQNLLFDISQSSPYSKSSIKATFVDIIGVIVNFVSLFLDDELNDNFGTKE